METLYFLTRRLFLRYRPASEVDLFGLDLIPIRLRKFGLHFQQTSHERLSRYRTSQLLCEAT
jgi:hypothetical protein